MFKRIMNILFDEEEIIVPEETVKHKESYEIPVLKPIKEQKVVQKKPAEPVQTAKPSPLYQEEEAFTEQVSSGDRPKSMMISIDEPSYKTKVEKRLPKEPISSGKQEIYEPTQIISPIFGGPKVEAKPIAKPKTVVQKSREPLTQIISPIYGKVEIENKEKVIDPLLFELNVEDMLTHEQSGAEVQASLLDFLEGFENEE